MSFTWRKNGDLISVSPKRSVNGCENSAKPLPPLLPLQVPAGRAAGNHSRMNSNWHAWNAYAGKYHLSSLTGSQSDMFNGVFRFCASAHCRLPVYACTAGSERKRGGGTRRYRFYAITDDMSVLLA